MRLHRLKYQIREMKELYEANGIKVRNCTLGGTLNDILEYVSLEEVLA